MNPQEKRTTFDNYADDYAALIRDPVRDKFAAGSGFFFERKIEVIRRFLSRRGVDTRKLAWLDVGCGQGDLLRLGRTFFQSSTGCDPSRGMLESCADLDVRHQPATETLPFGDGSFDFVTAVCVYHHVAVDRRQLLTAEAFRVLRPRGIFCVIEHNPYNPVTRLIVSRTPVDADAHLLTAKQTRKLLMDGGSKVLGDRYFLMFPERLKIFVPVEDVLSVFPFGGQYAVFSQRC